MANIRTRTWYVDVDNRTIVVSQLPRQVEVRDLLTGDSTGFPITRRSPMEDHEVLTMAAEFHVRNPQPDPNSKERRRNW